jgi:hypothetical protein
MIVIGKKNTNDMVGRRARAVSEPSFEGPEQEECEIVR